MLSIQAELKNTVAKPYPSTLINEEKVFHIHSFLLLFKAESYANAIISKLAS